ncbi:flagellin [Candidatus Magnetaquicoccus inordinatus]|uniref:flagellin N-terminal helical domain-containing protein n=1 Tax=Candidatus Magnetaquicoccus inordinatus TaxID=2496818 RepID=UPI00102AEB70|nr:flagellin [Candidatus Magnetaquicoccus inordinatus]
MSLNINTNMVSLLAVQGMDNNSKSLSRTFQRLISGSRINTAGDDPSGMAVSSRLAARIRGSNMAVRNAQDAVSVAQVADAAMEETSNALQKIRDIMVTAAGPGLSSSDRAGLQTEVNGLIQEIQRIATGTKFNGKALLTGSYSGQKVQVGANGGDYITMSIGNMSASALGVKSLNGTDLKAIGATVLTVNSAVAAASFNIDKIDTALSSVSDIRARLGAVQNRLNTIVTGLQSLVAATTESRSRIVDTDIASEVAAMTSMQIKQQVGAAILAQANQGPTAILTLLK